MDKGLERSSKRWKSLLRESVDAANRERTSFELQSGAVRGNSHVNGCVSSPVPGNRYRNEVKAIVST